MRQTKLTDWKRKTRNPISKVNLSNKFFIDFCINETVANLERVFSIYQHEYTVVEDHLWRHTTPFLIRMIGRNTKKGNLEKGVKWLIVLPREISPLRLWKLVFSMIAEKHYEDNKARENQPVGTPMHRLLRDPYIAIIAGALVGML